ncbi:DDE-type integrase/transposase/recombinase [Tepidiforma sp.]|uniref:DDE-type integrase/transposase/recombinase n=1 Tax=Tepidiforma sp. TaxID=2682230 RepID=UPI002ADD792B|nr:DDE-type integrase/transposase/recombinase [Tepidiforma sp.]
MRLRLLVPEVKRVAAVRPAGCRWCGSPLLQRHQRVPKALIDTQVQRVEAVRYRCASCGRTFRHYPEGVGRYRQSERLMALAALLWTLGLSEWATSAALGALGVRLHRSSVHRDRLRAGALLRRRATLGGRVRVLGADETVVRVRGAAQLVGFVVDGESGRTVGVEVLVEQDSAAFRRWLERYTQALGVEVLVTDDLATYRPASLELGVRQQVCVAHVRRWVSRRLRQIEGWEEVKALLRALVRALPADGGRQLMALEPKVRRAPPLRRLVVDLIQRWPALVFHQGRPWVPATNNRTEQAIGKSKVRFKTVRGFKSVTGALAGVALTQWLYSGAAQHDLRELVA